MTKRENYNALRALAVASKNEELVAFIDHEVELLNKKNSYKSTKPTKAQQENVGIKEQIVAVMTAEPMTISDIQDADATGTLGELSNQKISALLAQLIADGKVVKTVVKRKAYFALAE
jgi:hypothetical protein